jgi:crotonobetainyl-CoA:carnitine CoA-transferase CaiB-like acyl-CoA transferase
LLEGVKVVELATVIAAPACAAVLADLGAEVLKIESPTAPDVTRSWKDSDDPDKTASPHLGNGSGFTQFNRGKQSLTLNYATPEGLKIMKELLAEADVFITNVRNKSLIKAGLDYQSLKNELPQLIYGHLSAWGLDGAKKDDPGYDFGAFWGYTGVMEIARSSDDSPMPRFPGAIGDNVTSMQLVAGIALALFHRQNTGEGQLVDAALIRSGIWALAHPIMGYAGGNGYAASTTSKRSGKTFPASIRGTTEPGKRRNNPLELPYKCKDDGGETSGWLQMLGMEMGRHWDKTFLAVLGPEQAAAFIPLGKSVDLVEAATALDAAMATKTYAEWHAIFDAADVYANHCICTL